MRYGQINRSALAVAVADEPGCRQARPCNDPAKKPFGLKPGRRDHNAESSLQPARQDRKRATGVAEIGDS